MGFITMVLLELLLLFCAGAVFFGEIRGLIIAGISLSVLNWQGSSENQFLLQEGLIVFGVFAGSFLFFFVKRKLRTKQVVVGFAGSLMALVMFGAVFNPLIALLGWLLVVGAGLVLLPKNRQIFWIILPLSVRAVLGLGVIIYGNYLA